MPSHVNFTGDCRISTTRITTYVRVTDIKYTGIDINHTDIKRMLIFLWYFYPDGQEVRLG